MGESRQELVSWVNYTLNLTISKVEQCGTGAVYCQLFDSIHLDVPMGKVKFDVNTEYQYLNNFKILQSCFTRHRIDRSVPVERLVKCRFQDNLEFLQWFKRYWDTNYDGHEYDATARRRGQQVTVPGNNVGGSRPASSASHPTPGSGASRTSSRTISSSAHRTSSATSRPQPPTTATSRAPANSRRSVSAATPGYAAPTAGGPAARKMATAAGNGVAGLRTSSAAGGPASKATMAALQEAREHAAALEQENEDMARDFELVRTESAFYFDKLRDIEVLALTAAEVVAERKAKLEAQKNISNNDNNDTTNTNNPADPTALTSGISALGITDKEAAENPELSLLSMENLINEIQVILYSTQEGFERPEQIEGEEEQLGYENEHMDMEETF